MAGILTAFIEANLPKGKPKIGFGLLELNEEILASLRLSQPYAEIVLVGPESLPDIDGFEVIRDVDPETRLVSFLVDGTFAGVVRGTVDDFKTYRAYKQFVGEEAVKDAINPGVIQDAHGREFLLDPISNPEAWTKEEKLRLAQKMAAFLMSLQIKPKVGVLAGTRHDTYAERKTVRDGVVGVLNVTYEDADWVVAELSKVGIEAKNYSIDLSVAVDEACNIVLAQNGMVGNQIFRAITLLGGGKLLAAPRIALPHCYEDNSRRETDYVPHIQWLVATINARTNSSPSPS